VLDPWYSLDCPDDHLAEQVEGEQP
jgi:hypothetical protein